MAHLYSHRKECSNTNLWGKKRGNKVLDENETTVCSQRLSTICKCPRSKMRWSHLQRLRHLWAPNQVRLEAFRVRKAIQEGTVVSGEIEHLQTPLRLNWVWEHSMRFGGTCESPGLKSEMRLGDIHDQYPLLFNTNCLIHPLEIGNHSQMSPSGNSWHE